MDIGTRIRNNDEIRFIYLTVQADDKEKKNTEIMTFFNNENQFAT